MSVFQPLPGRDCGECAVCCVELAIDDPELTKPDEVPCPHMRAGAGLGTGACTVYEARPKTCRTWYCGWRLIATSDALRPDRSKVLMIPEVSDAPGYQRGGLKLAPVGSDLSVLLQDEVIDLAGKCIARDIPIFLTYGAGPRAKRILINELTKMVVGLGDRAAFVRRLSVVLKDLEAAVGKA